MIPEVNQREKALLIILNLTVLLAFVAQYFLMNLFFLVYSPDYAYTGTNLEQWISATSTGFLVWIDGLLLVILLFINFYYLIFPIIDNFAGRYRIGINLIDMKNKEL